MASATYCLKLTYDGRNFSGYQVQPMKRTVQGEVEEILSLLFKKKIILQASGRTDAGVHARGQIIAFHEEAILPPEKLCYALNRLLPRDIKVLDCQYEAKDFHPRFDAIAKMYRYRISYSDALFERPYTLSLSKPVNLEKMKEAFPLLEGERDFYNFSNRRRQEGSTCRHLYRIYLEEKEKGFDLLFLGNGFLYKMVRILVAYLLEIGYGKIEPEATLSIFQERDRKYTRKVAAPQGLYLEKVYYNPVELQEDLMRFVNPSH